MRRLPRHGLPDGPGMRILLDFGAIKAGGGAQLASAFLGYLQQEATLGHEFALLIPATGPLAGMQHSVARLGTLVSPSSYRARLQFEHGELQRFIAARDIQAIYTFFGAGLPHPPSVNSVVSVAYPTLCYPESPYWRNAGLRERLQVGALDLMRIRRLRRATTIIVETDIMKERVSKSVRFPSKRIRVIPPFVSTHVRELRRADGGAVRRFVLVSNNYTHKNLWRLYAVAQRARASGLVDFTFHLTVDKRAYLQRLVGQTVDALILERHFVFLGPVAPQDIMQVYESADCVLSLSDLESFSNNYLEAWRVGLPLLASDRDFARAICGKSALYVDPHDPDSVVRGMLQVRADAGLRRTLVEEGRRRLRFLPDLRERTTLVLAELAAPAAGVSA